MWPPPQTALETAATAAAAPAALSWGLPAVPASQQPGRKPAGKSPLTSVGKALTNTEAVRPARAGQKLKAQLSQRDGRRAKPRRLDLVAGAGGSLAVAAARMSGAPQQSPRGGKRDGRGPVHHGRGSNNTAGPPAESPLQKQPPQRGRMQGGGRGSSRQAAGQSNAPLLQIGAAWPAASPHKVADSAGPVIQRGSVARRMSNPGCAAPPEVFNGFLRRYPSVHRIRC